jgi:branched-chain amino acid transport system substrate-binding protein
MTKRSILGLLVYTAFILAFGWLPVSTRSASAAPPDQMVREAEARYASDDYAKARDIFVALSDSFPEDRLFSYFQFMIAKCEYQLQDYASAREQFREFVRRFPRSSYVGACYFMLGNVSFLEGEDLEAAEDYIYSYEVAGTDNLRLLAKRSLMPLLERRLSEQQLEKLGRADRDRKLAPKIWYYLGLRQHAAGRAKQASQTLNYYLKAFPDGEDADQVRQLLNDVAHARDETIDVGVLVPLSGEWSPYGSSLLNGVKLALSLGSPHAKDVRLVTEDTRGDFLTAAALFREMVSEDNAACVIGPLRSEVVAAVAVEAERSQVPLITPTASRPGLAALSDFVFQLSPTAESRGKALAQCAVKDEGMRDFVLLAPEEEGSESEASSFTKTVEGLGGKILASEQYPADTQDFSPYLRRIKSQLLGSPAAESEAPSFSDQIPVWVDGIFISADQAQMYDILSRIANLNVFGTIIGTEVCGERQVMEFAKNIDRQMIFVSGQLGSQDEVGRKRFSAAYLDQYQTEPDLVSMLGYDCMTLLLRVFEQTNTPLGIRAALAETSDFRGVAGGVKFDSKGENVMIPVYKLESGQVRRLR